MTDVPAYSPLRAAAPASRLPSASALPTRDSIRRHLGFPRRRPHGETPTTVEDVSSAEASTRHMRLVDPLAEPIWEQSLEACPAATIFHTAAWAAVLRDTYGFRPCYVVSVREGQPRCLLPLMECASVVAGRRGVALPFTDYLAPLSSEAEDTAALFDTALALGRERRWRTLELRGVGTGQALARPSLSYYRHVVNLHGTAGDLQARCESPVRRAIRKAERSGVAVRRERSLESVAWYYDLHCQTRQRHGLPPQPFAFFRNLHRRVVAESGGDVFLACWQGRPIAGAIFLRWRGRVLYKFGASSAANLDLRANNLVMWEAIQFYAAQGCGELDLGRTSLSQDGLRRFKRGWGAAESIIAYEKYDFARANFVEENDLASGWHTACFRRAPRGLLRLIGKLVYPHLT